MNGQAREICKSENLPREGRISGGTDEPLEGSDKADDDPAGGGLPPRSRTEAIPRRKGGGRFPQEPTRPPEARSMHVMSPANRVKRHIAEPQSGVRSRVRDERPPPGGPCQGHRASRGSA